MPSGLQVVCRAAARRRFAANDLKPRAKAANRNPYFRSGASDVARFRPPHTTGPGRTLRLASHCLDRATLWLVSRGVRAIQRVSKDYPM